MNEFDEIQWIINFFTNRPALDVAGINRVRNFVFLWNIYETYACNKFANIQAIDQAVEHLNGLEPITLDELTPYVNYFANRYFNADGTETVRFAGLKFRGNAGDQAAQNLVRQVLTRAEVQPKEVLKALLYILFRFRNNLFHGEKQIITLDTQIDNFIAANNILAIVLDRMKRNFLILD
jgi:hypothetical protein